MVNPLQAVLPRSGEAAGLVLLLLRGIPSHLSQEGFLNPPFHQTSIVGIVVLVQLCCDDGSAVGREGKCNLCFLKKHLWNANCVPWHDASSSLLWPSSAGGRPEGWFHLTALRGEICVYITQSILYLFWILSSDIKAADINL